MIKKNKSFLSKTFASIRKGLSKSYKQPEYKDPNWLWIVYLGVIAISVMAWVFYYSQGLTMIYNDSRSHLNVARRMVDNLQPGFTQIGSVWLPLFHLLELTTIWNDFMYRTGLSGSLISMISFFTSAVFIRKIAKVLGMDLKASLLAMVVFVLNPNMIYMQTTAMTESLMIATSLGTTYFFLKWVKYNQFTQLILSGFFAFLAVLTRYDGWMIFLAFSALVGLISFARESFHKAESDFILFSLLGAFGIFMWVGWNALIFNDPFYFLNGPFSAKAQQDILEAEGRLLTKNNLDLSIQTYFLTIKENVGQIMTLIASFGLVVALVSRINFLLKLTLATLLVPILFNIISLFLGQSAIFLPTMPPYNWFNVRYGLLALPALAIGIAFLANKRYLATAIITFLILLQTSLMYTQNNLITITDPTKGASGYNVDDIGNWLGTNAKDDMILIASSSHDPLIYKTQLPLKNFVTEGTGDYWKSAIANPTDNVKYIVMHEGDRVYQNINHKPEFKSNFILVYKGKYADIYQNVRTEDGSKHKQLVTIYEPGEKQ